MNRAEKLLDLIEGAKPKKPTPAEIAAVLKAEIPEYPSVVKTATYLLRHYAENTADNGYGDEYGKDELPTFRDFYIDQIGGAYDWSETYFMPTLPPNQKWMQSDVWKRADIYIGKVRDVLDKWKKKGTVPKWFKDDAYDHWEKWA